MSKSRSLSDFSNDYYTINNVKNELKSLMRIKKNINNEERKINKYYSNNNSINKNKSNTSYSNNYYLKRAK
jgi:hypothetical protein